MLMLQLCRCQLSNFCCRYESRLISAECMLDPVDRMCCCLALALHGDKMLAVLVFCRATICVLRLSGAGYSVLGLAMACTLALTKLQCAYNLQIE